MVKPIKKRDADATKSAILHAAEELFAAKGFEGTSISDISQKSGSSGPLILFHFKEKKGIYEAVKAAIVKRYDKEHKMKPKYENSFKTFLEDLVETMSVFYRDNPNMTRIANWARLEGDIEPWPGEEEWLHLYINEIDEAQNRGEVRDDLSPFNILIMISGAIHTWWEYHDHFMRRLGKPIDTSVMDEQFARQLLSFVLRGLSPAVDASNDPSKNPGESTDSD